MWNLVNDFWCPSSLIPRSIENLKLFDGFDVECRKILLCYQKMVFFIDVLLISMHNDTQNSFWLNINFLNLCFIFYSIRNASFRHNECKTWISHPTCITQFFIIIRYIQSLERIHTEHYTAEKIHKIKIKQPWHWLLGWEKWKETG